MNLSPFLIQIRTKLNKNLTINATNLSNQVISTGVSEEYYLKFVFYKNISKSDFFGQLY